MLTIIQHRPHQVQISLLHGIRAPLFGHRHDETIREGDIGKLFQYAIRDWVRRHDRNGLERTDVIVANSEFTAEMLLHYHGIEADEIIYPPVDTDDYYNDNPGDYYLYLGRLHPTKGIENIVEAFNKVDHRLIVAGKGPLKSQLKEMAGSKIEIVGYVSEERKRKLFAKARGFIQNTLAEPFGITTVEALASGTPVIAANVGNNPNLVEHGKTGVLFDREDGLTDFDRPQSVRPLLNAVKKAEEIGWRSETICNSVERYDTSRVRESWQSLLNRVE